MKILISNDDGITSEGLYYLASALKGLGKVFVVAPDKEQSATGHAITMHQPLRSKKIIFFDTDIDAWWVNGTPSDCIKLGIETLIKDKPDLIVSGINKGENLGTDILYSGTVSAAIEGAIFGIPSVAISYASHNNYDFKTASIISKKICFEIMKHDFPKNSILNVNIPECKIEEVKGIKICKLGARKYTNNFEERIDPRGNAYYWLAGELVDEQVGDEAADTHAIKNDYISITPIYIDLTYHEYINELKGWNFNI